MSKPLPLPAPRCSVCGDLLDPKYARNRGSYASKIRRCTFCGRKAEHVGTKGGYCGFLAVLLCVMITLSLCPSLRAQGNLGSNSSPVVNRQGIPLGNVKISVCQPLATTAASVTNNLAVLTMASNPITAGYVSGMQILVSGFTGGDTYFNAGTLTNGQIVSGYTILSVTPTTITFTLVHANASAGTNGTVLQEGNGVTSCAGLSAIYQDPALSVSATNPTASDQLGNWNVFAASGVYYVQFYSPTVTPTIKIIGVSIVSLTGIPGLSLNNIWTGNENHTGLETFSGGLNTSKLWAEIYPSALVGATCGDKIAAAIALLPANGGVLDINNACGLGSAATPWTAVTLPANVLLRIVEPGTYWISSISSSAGYGAISSIYPMPQFSNVNPTVQLKMGNGVNAAALINISGDYFSISNIALDGNKSNNGSAGPNILVNNGKRPHIERVATGNSNSHGIRIFSTGTSNVSNGAEIKDVLTYQNGGDGISCQGSNDAELTLVNMESNSGNGAGFHDCRTPRFVHDDFGGNTQGLNVDCTISGNGGIGGILVGSEFGNQFQNDIVITGYSGGTCATSWTITGNDFAGSGNRPANTYSDIVLVDGGNNTIVGNTIEASAAATSDKYAFNITETAGGRANPNTISGNMLTVIPANPWGTAPYFDSTSNGSIGQVIPTKAGCSGASLDLFDVTASASTPHKFLSTGSGNFQIKNSACSAAILLVTDAGNLQIPGVIQNTAGTATVGLTLKKGSGGGNYTTASTTYIVADSTNLCYTVTIPVGWKLGIQASGSIGTSTAIAIASAALTDNAACSTANAGLLAEAQIDAGAIGGTAGFSLSWVITGDGAAHNVALQIKTANGADSALLLNSSSTALPTMAFTLMPSN